jgi:hypothetical protein
VKLANDAALAAQLVSLSERKEQVRAAKAAFRPVVFDDSEGGLWWDAIMPASSTVLPHEAPHPYSSIFAARQSTYNDVLLQPSTLSSTENVLALAAARALPQQSRTVDDVDDMDDAFSDEYECDVLIDANVGITNTPDVCTAAAHPDIPASLHRSQRDCVSPLGFHFYDVYIS